MRKLIVSMNVTLDGYMSGPDCELDWHSESWSPDMGEQLAKELSKADTILLGRVSFQAMAKYWPSKARELLCPRADIVFAVMMNQYTKIVYSNALQETDITIAWHNSRLISGNLEKEIKKLKQARDESNKDIIIYGSGKLVAALIQLNLIDEYQLWVHPVILGKGKPLFRELKNNTALELLQSKTFSSGVVLLCYKPEKNKIRGRNLYPKKR